MNSKPFEELLQGYLEGSLSEEDCCALAQELAASEDRRYALAYHQVMEALLLQLGEPALDTEVILRALPDSRSPSLATSSTHATGRGSVVRFSSRKLWRPLLALAASLVFVVCGYLVVYRPHGGLGVRVAEIQGSGFRVQGSVGPASGVRSPIGLRVGDTLWPGDGIEVGADGLVKLAYLDGTQVELQRDTRLRVTLGTGMDKNAKRLSLDGGKLVCSAAPQKLPFEIKTPHAVARVVGTRFNLDVTALRTILAVQEGQVEFIQGDKSLNVLVGESATATDEGLKMMPAAAARIPAPNQTAEVWLQHILARADAASGDAMVFESGSVVNAIGGRQCVWRVDESVSRSDRRVWQTESDASGCLFLNMSGMKRFALVGSVMILPDGEWPAACAVPSAAITLTGADAGGATKIGPFSPEMPDGVYMSALFRSASAGRKEKVQLTSLRFAADHSRGSWYRFLVYFDTNVSGKDEAVILKRVWREDDESSADDGAVRVRRETCVGMAGATVKPAVLVKGVAAVWRNLQIVPLGTETPPPPAALLAATEELPEEKQAGRQNTSAAASR